MPLRSVKMKRFIFGFQRRVWCPKCTPESSNCLMVTTAMAGFAPLLLGHAVPGWQDRHADRFSRLTGWSAALVAVPASAPNYMGPANVVTG
jgi:hypothetical protein